MFKTELIFCSVLVLAESVLTSSHRDERSEESRPEGMESSDEAAGLSH